MKNLFRKLRNKKVLRVIIITAVILLVYFGFFYFEKSRDRVFIENSQVSAPLVNIAPSAIGKLTELDVFEGEKVKKGDALANVSGQTFYADTDGLIVMANNQIGSLVNPQSPIVQMVNPNDTRVAGTIDENKGLKDIKVGQVASFTVDAYPGKTFYGLVDEISQTAKQTQLSFSISSARPTQQFVVYVRFDANKYTEIKNGMSAKMTIYTKTK